MSNTALQSCDLSSVADDRGFPAQGPAATFSRTAIRAESIRNNVRKIEQILGLMHAARKIADLDFPTFRLHPLKGDLQGFWSITVRANWRIVFRFEGGSAFDVDLVDYH